MAPLRDVPSRFFVLASGYYFPQGIYPPLIIL